MGEKLHTVRSDHAIFKGPLPVTPTLFDAVDPRTKRKVRAWKVHDMKSKWKEDDGSETEYIVPGVTAFGPRLLEADDSEIIAGGMNSKGDFGVALAREANLFHWGPPATPKYMTEEARRVFVNTIVYMKQFDGAKQSVWRGMAVRDDMLAQLRVMGRFQKETPKDGYSEEAKKAHRAEWLPELKSMFSPVVAERFGDDEEKYRAVYEPNLGYVYVSHGTTWYAIDEDAKSLGTANNDVRSLEEWIELLGQPAESAKAKRLLEHYTRLSFPNASAWRQWLERSRDQLYFSDYYDYRFFAGPAAPAAPEREVEMAIEEMKIDEPSEVAPVSIGSAAVGYIPDRNPVTNSIVYETNKGALVTLLVRLKIADGWHLGGVADGDSSEVPKINIELPQAARWYGDWHTPNTYQEGTVQAAEHYGDSVLTRQLYFTGVPPGERDELKRVNVLVRGVVHYHACDKKRCLPPRDVLFETTIIVGRL